MAKSQALAKISPPRLTQVYARQRLFDRLDEARKHQVIWISAPAGSGKTTLVASYLKARKLSGIWYQIDVGDEDIASFFYYMGQAGSQTPARRRKPLPLLTPEYLAGLPTFARNFFRLLYGRLRRPGLLVLDNFQDISIDAPLQQAMLHGIAEIPEDINVLIISRSEPPAAMARLRASGSFELIGGSELKLTREESIGIAQLRTGKTAVSEDSLVALHEQTQGWMAGLVLMLEQAKDKSMPEALKDQGNQQVIFDYFAGEIFEHADPVTQDLLTRTAFLSKFTASMAARLTAIPQAAEILNKLTRRNYFTVWHAGSEPAYEYHPLFRKFLLSRAQDTYEPHQLATIQRQASSLLETNGDIENAVPLLMQAEEWDGVGRVILSNADRLVDQGRGITLAQWILSLPQDALQRSPWLLYWLGVCNLAFEPTSARGYLEKAFEAFKVNGDTPGLLLTWCALVDTFVYEWGNFTPLDHWIAEIETVLKKSPAFPSIELETRVSCAMFMAMMYRQPQHPDLPQWEQRVWQTVLNSRDPKLRMNIGNHLLIYYTWWIADLAKAEIILNTLQPLAIAADMPPLVRITWNMIASGFSWVVGESDKAVDTANVGLQCADQSGVHVWDMCLNTQIVFASLCARDFNRASDYLQRMAALLDGRRHMDSAWFYFLAAWNAMAQTNLPAARENVQLARKHGDQSGCPFLATIARIEEAGLMFYLGQPDEAVTQLRQAQEDGLRMRSKSIAYLAGFTAAAFAMEQGDEGACLKALRQSLDIGVETGYLGHTWFVPAVLLQLYVKALEHGIQTKYVQAMIRKAEMIPPEPPLHLENWPWAIKVYTLGRFGLLRGGEPLRITGKAQTRPLELLKALLAEGGREVSQEQLIQALWPDAEGDAGYRAFVTTLQRLRKLVETKDALQLSDGKLTLDPRSVWVDSWAFERLLGQADSDPISLERALSLYQGAFLSKEREAPWIFPARERLRRKFLRATEKLGKYWEEQQCWREAGGCYERGLDVDELAEDLYRRLMQCYVQLGQPSEAMKAYERCREALTAHLGVMPSGETESIYQALRQKQQANF